MMMVKLRAFYNGDIDYSTVYGVPPGFASRYVLFSQSPGVTPSRSPHHGRSSVIGHRVVKNYRSSFI